MIVTKSTAQKSEFLVPSQFHPQHFRVKLPFQLKRISLLTCFMAIYRCPKFFSHTQQQLTFSKNTHITDISQIDIKYITACSNIPAIYMFSFFLTPKNWQQSFSVPLKSHPQHFQVMLITFFFSSQESAFCAPGILTFFSHTLQQPCRQTTDKFTKLISIFKELITALGF